MKGRIGITEDEAGLLIDVIRPDDLYVEIGCLWGGTAVLAGLHAERVISVDFMKGLYWDEGDPMVGGERVRPGAVLDNLALFGVAHKVSLVRAGSFPWPLPGEKP